MFAVQFLDARRLLQGLSLGTCLRCNEAVLCATDRTNLLSLTGRLGKISESVSRIEFGGHKIALEL
jgi:hypothetical protein